MTAVLMPLKPRDLEVLYDLAPTCSDDKIKWHRPLDVGGGSGSHHSNTLGKLVRHGYVETMQRNALSGDLSGDPRAARMSRGSKVYRITPIGLDVVIELHGPLPTRAEHHAKLQRVVKKLKL